MASLPGLAVCRGPNLAGPRRFRPFLHLFPSAPVLPSSRALLFVLLLCSPSVVLAGWVQQQSGTTVSLRSVYFINAQTGWVVGDSNFILRTTDGGENWVRYVVDPTARGLSPIRFRDLLNGYVGGGNKLYRTTDGGATWQLLPQTLSAMISNFVFVTPSKGWLVCAMAASGDGGIGFLYQTVDSGRSWALRDSFVPFMYRDIAFADTLFGMLTADNHAVFVMRSEGFVKHTTNGGATWDTVNYGPVAYGKIRFSSSNYAWRTWYIFIPNGSQGYGVERTTDRGRSWTSIWSGHPYNHPSIAVPDTLTGWVLNNPDTLFNTHDAGATWSWQIPGQYLNDLFFTDSLNGWIVGRNGLILHTSDGGSGVWSEPLRLTSYASRLTVVPNPFVSFTSLPGHSSNRFVLYDLSGRKVGVYKGNKVGWDVSPGIYFLLPDTRSSLPDPRVLRIVKLR